MHPFVALVLAGLLLGSAASGQVARLGGELVLPEGAVADAFARVERTTVPRPIDAERWPDWGPAAWGAEPPWRAWVELVRAEARAEEPDAERRALLAALARAQGRDGDAWRHLVACDDPGTLSGKRPRSVPGSSHASLASVLAGEPLPDGALLAPALPPAVADARGRLRGLVGRPAEHRGVRVGDALLALKVVVEADGVQVDVTHLEGPPVSVRVRPPVPPGVEIALLYADWERQDDATAPVTLHLDAGEEGRTQAVWGRFRPRNERWPAPEPDVAFPPRGPLVVLTAGDREDPRPGRFCQALEELFGRPCTLQTDPTPGTSLFEPIRLSLGAGASADKKLVAMISLAERWALAGVGRSQ